MATYKRFQYFVNRDDFVDLTQSEFENAKLGKVGIMEALFIEELLDMVLKNYSEFEETIYSLGLKSMMHLNGGWKTHIDDVLLVNRRLINLLTSCRIYVDHVPQKLRRIYGNQHPILDEFKQATKREYDSSLGYRFCYALRNFAQHGDLPVDGLFFDMDWVEEGKRYEHRVAVQKDIAELDGTDFSKKVLAEIKERFKDKIDIKPLIRENIVSIGNLNKTVRDRLKPDVDRWEQWIMEVVTKSEHGTFPVLAHFDDSDNLVEEFRVMSDWPDRLRTILRKNMSTTHYHLHYISGEAAVPKCK